MSAEELRAAIERVSVDIERQKDVLKKLETSKRRQLNAVLDPMARLPLEISTEIFIQCLPPFPERGSSHIPMLLLNVCNAWTEIALSTPALWSAIRVQFPRPEGFENVLEKWLQHARSRPLSISLHGSFDDAVAAVVRRHSQQLKSLVIFHDGRDYCNIGDPLRGVGPGPFPLLESLTIGASFTYKDVECISFDPNGTLSVFHLTPNLVECTFDKVSRLHRDHLIPREQVVLPTLRRLKFGTFAGFAGDDGDDGMLRYLTLPGLQTLFLSMSVSSMDDLTSFLTRSLPPLQNLAINAHSYVGFPQLEPCLRLLPTLTHLVLCAAGYSMPELFTALGPSASSLLPHLQSLRILRYCGSIPDSSWMALYRALSNRRSHFAHFTLRWAAHWNELRKPKVEICAAFQQLVSDGMEIHIGSGGCNFIQD
ncbi:hypothetical protein DFH07DRAFT_815083 [Mycena maculata]|uniref:F-box domain-containing protein n=1 Tax=Mycena maculata TaxID=230809 RepID=A0AAD7JGH2_9AGAR|nr:hypothetical protein DFH07DRAFT_815083 [Mycena maculata]